MKIEIIRSGDDWIVLDGSGKVLVHSFRDYGSGLPPKVLTAIENALLKQDERDPYGVDDDG